MRINVALLVVVIAACKGQFAGESKAKITKIKAGQYAHEGFPSWAASHPDKACPEKLGDLSEYMGADKNDTNDAWGRPLKMLCGAAAPPGARGFGVLSVGEDGKEGTADDIKSWE